MTAASEETVVAVRRWLETLNVFRAHAEIESTGASITLRARCGRCALRPHLAFVAGPSSADVRLIATADAMRGEIFMQRSEGGAALLAPKPPNEVAQMIDYIVRQPLPSPTRPFLSVLFGVSRCVAMHLRCSPVGAICFPGTH